MQKKTFTKKEESPINTQDDTNMIRLRLRVPKIQKSPYNVNCKNVGLTETQKQNLPKLGVTIGQKTKEKDILKILRKRKTFKNIFGQETFKNKSRSDKILSQLK